MYDKDGSGTIELNEMVEVMSALHNFEGSKDSDASEARGKRIFSELDINDDGEITCEEFVRGCMHDPELVRIISAGGIDPMEEDSDWASAPRFFFPMTSAQSKQSLMIHIIL